MGTPIPTPKVYHVTSKKIPLPTGFGWEDASFAGPFSVFSAYAKKAYGAAFVPGTGILLKKNATDEFDYVITVADTVEIAAKDSAGMNHALATLLQMIEKDGDALTLPCGTVQDRCDSQWRGLMLDLSRCWHEADYIFRAADLCWLYKINRLQLHLTDDQGIRFPFKSFPLAVNENHYTPEQIAALVSYCKERDIIPGPELDAPGHARPFNDAYPEIFGAQRGLMSAKENTFNALKIAYQEIADAFPDSPWIHVGGDEARLPLWEECAETRAYCKEHGIEDVHKLYGHYILRLIETVKEVGRTPVVWEGFSKECNDMIPKDTLVFAWESLYQTAPDLLESGFCVLNASWQPLYVVTHSKMWPTEEILDWEKNRWQNWWDQSFAYEKPIVVSPDANIGGGQMCSWGDKMTPSAAYAPREEMIREEFGSIRLRLPALAEKLWNSYTTPDKQEFMAGLARTDRLLSAMF